MKTIMVSGMWVFMLPKSVSTLFLKPCQKKQENFLTGLMIGIQCSSSEFLVPVVSSRFGLRA